MGIEWHHGETVNSLFNYVILCCRLFQKSIDDSVAVLPTANPSSSSSSNGSSSTATGTVNEAKATKSPPKTVDKEKGEKNKGKATKSISQVNIHPNQYHYRSFDPSSPPIEDYHFKKRNHDGLEPGSLDDDGILAHTDFEIDLSRVDADNDEHFAEFCERRRKFEQHLKLLYEKTESEQQYQSNRGRTGIEIERPCWYVAHKSVFCFITFPFSERTPAPLPPNITYVRPFLSSTFKDFNEERNICFPESDTRIMTNKGMLFLHEIEEYIQSKESIQYACFDIATQSIVYRSGELVYSAPPERLVEFTQDATKKQWASDDTPSAAPPRDIGANDLSIRVTPNHRMYVQFRPEVPPQRMAAEELAPEYECACSQEDDACVHRFNTFSMPCSAIGGIATDNFLRADELDEQSPVVMFSLNTTEKVDAFIQLYAAWITCGQFSSDNGALTIVAPHHTDLLTSLLEQVGLTHAIDWSHAIDTNHIHIHHPSWSIYLRSFLPTSGIESRCPDWFIHRLSSAQTRLALDTIAKLQHARDATTHTIITTSTTMRDQLLQVCIHAGYSAHFIALGSIPSSSSTQWSIRYTADLPSVSMSRSDVSHSSSRPYSLSTDGRIWCVNVDHSDHLILVQRAARSDLKSALVLRASRPIVVGNCFAQSFPRLEKLCNERNLFFAPLDLRWGVTSEQSGSGQVIKICLEEIDRSRPYFVCSLGFRNGWALMPQDNPEDQYVQLLQKTFELAEQQFDWVLKCRDRSVTELEIMHGALNDPSLSPRCFFYFRDVSFLTTLPKKDRKLFAEIGESEKRLQQLKTRIVAAGFPIRYFNTPQQMSDYLEEDLKASIERDFPIQKLTPLDRELKDHQAFAEMRTRVYVGGEKYVEALDEFLMNESEGAPQICLITGSSGSGKSSLLANWMKQVKTRARQNHFQGKKQIVGDATPVPSNEAGTTPQPTTTKIIDDGTPRVFHWNVGLFQDRYIGSTSDSTQPGTLLRWLLVEIKQRFEYIENPVPQDPKKIIEDFPEFVESASSNVPILLVLDGLDQLMEDEDAHHLLWLPKEWPKTVKIVLSTVHGSLTHKTLVERNSIAKNTMFLSVEDVSDEHCLQLIRTFLGSYGKNLDHEQEARIMACERTRNPLYLITFLQEVRVFGSFESLNQRIDHYMSANSVAEMFLKVIGRLEDDFDSNAPNLVRMLLSLMMVSRRGLNEVELKGALELALGVSAQNQTFPGMEFSALMLRLDQQLVDQRGLRKFSHVYMKTAVETRYFSKSTDGSSKAYTSQSAIRSVLAQYFCSIPVSERKVEEAPWHLWTILHESMESGHISQPSDADALTNSIPGVPRKLDLVQIQRQLQEQITDLEAFEKLKEEYKYDLHKYWLLLESIRGGVGPSTTSHKGHQLVLSYTAQSYSNALQKWKDTKKPTPLEFAEKAESIGTFLIATDRYNGSEIFLDQALEIRSKEQGSEHAEVEMLISKKANLFYRQGRYEEALPLYQQSLKIVEQNDGDKSVRSSVLRTSIAGLLKEQGKFEESQPLYEKSLQDKITLLGPKHPVVAVSMSNLAELHLRLHNPAKALPLYEEALQIMESERGRSHPEVATIVSSLASCYMQLQKYSEAIKLYERARKIKEDLLGANHVSVAVVLNNLAATHQKQGDTAKALKLLERSLKIRQAVHGKDSPLIAQTLNNMGDVYLEDKKYRHAASYFSQALEIMEKDKGKYHVDLMGTLTSQAKLHYEKEEFDQCLPIYQRQLEIMEKNYAPDDERVQQCLNNIGMVHQSMNNFEEALPYHLRELHISTKKHGGVSKQAADVLMILGVLFVSLDKTDTAVAIFKRCFVMRRDSLGLDAEPSQEAKGWITDLSEEDELDESAIDSLTLDNAPLPDEIGPAAQAAALPNPSDRAPTPKVMTHHAPQRSMISLPPIGIKPSATPSLPASSSSSGSSLPPIGLHRPTASSSTLPALPGQTGAAPAGLLSIRAKPAASGNVRNNVPHTIAS